MYCTTPCKINIELVNNLSGLEEYIHVHVQPQQFRKLIGVHVHYNVVSIETTDINHTCTSTCTTSCYVQKFRLHVYKCTTLCFYGNPGRPLMMHVELVRPVFAM